MRQHLYTDFILDIKFFFACGGWKLFRILKGYEQVIVQYGTRRGFRWDNVYDEWNEALDKILETNLSISNKLT